MNAPRKTATSLVTVSLLGVFAAGPIGAIVLRNDLVLAAWLMLMLIVSIGILLLHEIWAA